MNRRNLLGALGLVAVVVVTSATNAVAQPRRDVAVLAAKVAKLETQLAELEKAAVAVPTLTQTVQSLSVRIIALANSLDVLRRQQRTIPDAVQTLDALSLKVRAMQQQLVLLTTKLAGVEQTSMAAPSASADGGGVHYDNGFVFSTADKRYSLGLSGFAQVRYAGLFDRGLDSTDAAGFVLSRTRAIIAGKLGDKLRFRAALEFQASPVLLDYFLDYKLTDTISVRAGGFRSSFTRSYISARPHMSFVERAVAPDTLGLGRDVGVSLAGELADGQLSYRVGVQNGAGRNKVNDNIDMLLIARADIAVLGKRLGYRDGDLAVSEAPLLTVGIGAAHDLTRVPDKIDQFVLNTDVDGDGDHDNVQVILASADAMFRYRGFELLVEAVLRHERWGTIFEGQSDPVELTLTDAVGTDPTRTFIGAYGHATYFAVPKKLLVGVRASYTELPFLGLTGSSSSVPSADSRFDLDALVTLYNSRGYRFLAFMYTLSDFSPGRARQHRVILDAMLKW